MNIGALVYLFGVNRDIPDDLGTLPFLYFTVLALCVSGGVAFKAKSTRDLLRALGILIGIIAALSLFIEQNRVLCSVLIAASAIIFALSSAFPKEQKNKSYVSKLS